MLMQIFLFNVQYLINGFILAKYENLLNLIRDYFYNLNKDNLNRDFWNVISSNNLDTLDILPSNKGYKQEFPISNIFQYFQKSNNICALNTNLILFVSYEI